MPDFYVVQARERQPVFTADDAEGAAHAYVDGLGPGQYGVVVVPIDQVWPFMVEITEAVPAQLAVAAIPGAPPSADSADAAPDAPDSPPDP